jgi:Zn-finger nucleic acid-binding protein
MKPKDTEAPCPACGGNQKLQERLLGDKKIPFSECSRCAGMWLEWEAFQIACQSSLNRSPMQLSALKPKKNNHPQTGRIYRQCPHCSEVMNRVNYARYSGIIIDACVVNNHGLWFDFDELPSVLSWLHQGGKHDRRVTGDLSVVERINTLSELNPEQITVNKAQTPDDDIVYIIDEEIDLDSVLKKLFTK